MTPKCLQFLFFCFVLFDLTASAQTKPDSVNSRTKNLQLNFRYAYSFKSKDYSMPTPAPAFVASNKKTLHEFELNTLSFDRKTMMNWISGRYVESLYKTVNVALRYQYTLNLTQTGRIIPQLGFSLTFGYLSTKNDPVSPYEFNRKSWGWYSQAHVYPQVRLNTGKKTYMNLALPIDLWQGEMRFQRISNPNLPIRQQTNGGYSDNFGLIDSTLRIALGIGISL